METTTAPAITRITVADLTTRLDGRVATYKLGERTYTVLALSHGVTVSEIVRLVEEVGHDKNLDAYVTNSAYDAGIRLDF